MSLRRLVRVAIESVAACASGALLAAGFARFFRACGGLFLTLGLGLGLGLSQVQAAELDVVTPDRSPAYTEAAQAIATEWARLAADKSEARLLYLNEPYSLDTLQAGTAKVIVTLGSDALSRVLARDLRVPVIAALIPKAGFERIVRDAAKKPAAPVHALYLEQPITRQVELLRLALPEAKRVGVLWGAESGRETGAVGAALQARGLNLVGAYVGDAGQLFSGLKTALDDTDVLLALPDPVVYNGSSIANVLLATYRARVPVMAFSPAYARAGAMLSLHSSPKQIGQQAAAMARSQGLGSGLQGSQFPADFTVSVNEQVARSLGLSLDEQALGERLRRAEKRP